VMAAATANADSTARGIDAPIERTCSASRGSDDRSSPPAAPQPKETVS
jgi:hypothetical protein